MPTSISPAVPATDPDLELVLTRDVPVPPARLFHTWGSRLADWWAPRPLTTPVCEVDLRAGGVLRTVMRAPDGTEFACGGLFLEVVTNERIVFSDAFVGGWRPNPGIFFTAIITFDPLPGGGTRYTARARHWTPEACRRHEAMGFHQGWGQCLDQLVAVASDDV
ncbi:MAG: SRPBCC family protein [Opitutaceae bacterium]|nr:SRPBCC family protein [Opitutaceae bacterium]